jgi:DNA-binding protein YbaB
MTEEKEVLEDLIVIATNNAKKEIEVKSSEEMSKITGGLKLPPGFKLPF